MNDIPVLPLVASYFRGKDGRVWRCRREQFHRAGTVSIEEVFRVVGARKYITSRDVTVLCGKEVKLDSIRYRVYLKKGVRCVECGLEGSYFAVERSHANARRTHRYHLNLYHLERDGTEEMMTVDHIIPKSRGGHRVLENLQPMCRTCNELKGNTMEASPCSVS